MRRPATALAFLLLAVPALQGCGGVRAGTSIATLGGAPAESSSLSSVGPASVLHLRRPAYVALVEFDTAGARVLSMSEEEPLDRGRYTLETPTLLRLANRPAGPCRASETLAVPGERPAGSPRLRATRQKHRMNGQVYCRRRSTEPLDEAHRHLLLIASEVPFAPELPLVIQEVGHDFAALEAGDPDALTAELLRAAALGPQDRWTARVYHVVAVR
jgi:hypothetical protein